MSAFIKDKDDLIAKNLCIAGAVDFVDKDTLNGTINYSLGIESEVAAGYNLLLSLDINSIDVADPTLQFWYSESADNSSWDTAVQIGTTITYTNHADDFKICYGKTFDPQVLTKAYVKFGWELTLDASETGDATGGLVIIGTRPYDTSTTDYRATIA